MKRCREGDGDQAGTPPAAAAAAAAATTQKRAPRQRLDLSARFAATAGLLRPQDGIADPRGEASLPPRARELLAHKAARVAAHALPPLGLRCDLRTADLPRLLGARFDVLLVDPPWEEYRSAGRARRAWTFAELRALELERVADSPSFVFLWCGATVAGLEHGRQLLRKWGFRRCEDICWLKTSSASSAANAAGVRAEAMALQPGGLFVHTKEHCLMGIRGTVRRNADGHFVHTNVDTDIIVAPPFEDEGHLVAKPDEVYRYAERFCLGTRRLELFGNDRNLRPGWVTVGDEITESNYSPESFIAALDAVGGRLLGTTPEIEFLRPRSPTRLDP